MRLRHAVVKRSRDRLVLHDLRSCYHADLNETALRALENALAAAATEGPGRALVDKLGRRGLVDQGPFEPVPRRGASDLTSIEVEPASRCNLDCGHCFARLSGAMMSDETFAAVLRGADVLGAVELRFSGGEPLLNRRCLDWVEAAGRAGLRARLFTNGTLISGRTARRLAGAGVARVTVSLDGLEDAHDALRGAGSFRRAEHGIRNLVEAGVSVSVATVAHPANLHQVAALPRFCREELGVAGVRVGVVSPLGRAAVRPDLQLGAARLGVLCDTTGSAPRHAPPGRLPCGAGVERLFVAARGTVHACHLFVGPAPALGSLTREALETIYATSKWRPAGQLLERFKHEQLRGCRGCAALPVCAGGCRARAWSLTGDALGVDPVSCALHAAARAPSPPAAGSAGPGSEGAAP